ncbi:MAG: porin [Pseudolabrys sp.]|nr:porin [Pseudolabrys sp.]
MKMVKSLLLGTAAGLVAMTGAQAADLPVKAKPVQYVKICSLYGAGFYYIPGTDTCLKVGGFVRAEINFNAGGSFNPYRSQNFDTPARDFQTMRTRAGFTLDARSQTEYGTLRSYAIIAAMQTNGGAVGGTPYSTPFSNFAFIQFAGFTAGSTASFFEFDGQGYSNFTPYITSAQAGGGIGVFGYTAQLGNGLSASIAAEDPTVRRSAIANAVAGNTATYGGRRWPDVVANLRIDQAWGSAQIMGAIHDVYGVNTLATNTTANATGYAFGGGLKINLPMLGKGDNIVMQGTYAKGATNYLFSQSGAGGIGAFALTTGFVAATNTALGPVFDAVFTGAAGTTAMELSTGYHFTGGFEHYWVSNLRTSLYGGYGRLRYSDAASAALAVVAGAGTAGSANFSAYQIGSRTVWTPVTNLDLSVDVVYSKVQTAFAGSTTATYGTFQDKGFWAGMFRAQRNFYP